MARKKSKSKKSRTSKPPKSPTIVAGAQRLNKILAAAGLGSRREVEELIVQGRVEVDREIVTNLGIKVDPAQVEIRVDGEVVRLPRPVYYALNKPKGVLSTNYDPSGRPRVVDFVPGNERVFSVGRLDQHSEGLILLTNDGDLAQRLAHPRYGVQKTYYVTVAGEITREQLRRLEKGVYLAEGLARIDGARIRRRKKTCTELEITLSEGKNREIRRLLARAGHKVMTLKRVAIGPLRLGRLPVGAVRRLTSTEVAELYAAAETAAKRKGKSARGTKKSLPAERVEDRIDTGSAELDNEWAQWDDVIDTTDALGPQPEWNELDDDFVTPMETPRSTGTVIDFDESDAAYDNEANGRGS